MITDFDGPLFGLPHEVPQTVSLAPVLAFLEVHIFGTAVYVRRVEYLAHICKYNCLEIKKCFPVPGALRKYNIEKVAQETA